jgi:ABC-type microcin C transport system permease subunit YejE
LKVRFYCSAAGAGFIVQLVLLFSWFLLFFLFRSGFNRFLLQYVRKSPAAGAGFILVYFT